MSRDQVPLLQFTVQAKRFCQDRRAAGFLPARTSITIVRFRAIYSCRLGEFGPIVCRTADDSALVPPWAEVCRDTPTPTPYASARYRRVWGSVSRSLPLLPEAYLQASFLSHPGELQRVTRQRPAGGTKSRLVGSLRDPPHPQVSLEADSIASYRLQDQSHLKSLTPNQPSTPMDPRPRR